MTPGEWRQVKDEVDTLFGKSSQWAKAEDAYKNVRNVTYRAVMDAVQDAFNDGRTRPPSMSEIVTAARRRGGVIAGVAGPCQHVTFSIFVYHDDGTASEGMCTGCRTEMKWPTGKIRSVGDIEERAKAKREDMDAVAP